MFRSSIFPTKAKPSSPFMTKRLIRVNPRRKTSEEIKLDVINTFRSGIKVKTMIEAEDDSDENFKGKGDGDAWNSHSNYNHKTKWDTIGWWEPPMECLPLDFCRDTSLHGLKYIGQPKRHLSERIFWFVAFTIGIGTAAYLISDVWVKYKSSPVIVSFEPSETNIDKIPFPAVTICNMNKVLRSRANEIIEQAQTEVDEAYQFEAEKAPLVNVYNLDHVCTSSKSFTKQFNFSATRGVVDKDLVAKAFDYINSTSNYIKDKSQSAIQDFLKNASQPCSEMIPLCVWHNKVENCSTLFRPIETDFGKCCTFNMVPQTLLRVFQNDTRDNEEENKKWLLWDFANALFPSNEPERLEFPRRQIRAGKSFGLSFLLDPDLEEYFCTTTDSTGFQLSTHLATETPHVIDFGLGINPNSEVFVDVRPEITTADKTISHYDLSKRQCYFPGEFKLHFYNYYTVANCIDECVANATHKNCSCTTRFYMPRDNNQSLCGPTNFDCVDKLKRKLSESGGLKTICDKCLPPCTEINYAAQTTSTPMQKDENVWTHDDPDYQVKWKRNNVSIVHIFFGIDSTYARVRKQLYGVTDLIANTGGLMGLCLGFSGLSAMEVIYFLSLRAWCRKRRKRTLGSRVAKKFRDLWTKLKGLKTYGKESRENSTNYPGRFDLTGLHHRGGLPPVSITTPIMTTHYSNSNRIFTSSTDNNLPDYSSVVNEINPYYTNRYWQHLEMKSEL